MPRSWVVTFHVSRLKLGFQPGRLFAFKQGREQVDLHDGKRRAPFAAFAEAILRLYLVSTLAGGDHPGCAGGGGYVWGAADGRREIALFPTALTGAGGVNGRGVAADCADEGPGGRLAGERRASDVSQFVALGGRLAAPAAGSAQWRISAALRRPREADARGFSR